ncbi:16970_t:CDS:2, partial [Gigaspora rosea]
VRFRYNQWMINNPHQLTPAGRIRKPAYSTLAQWVGESWDKINPLEMDGSEDDLVFNYEALGEDLENSNEENIEEFEESNFNDISGEEYEETEGSND